MASKAILRIIFFPFVRFYVVNRERMSRAGAHILATNHISHFDPPVLTISSPRKIDWMAMVELFENPIVRCWLRSVDTFPVDRAKPSTRSLRDALSRLKRGHVVGMFPEGGIRDGATSILGGARMRPGIGAIAQMSGAPVVPCVVLGSDRLYAKRSWRPLRKVRVYVAFGETMTCPAGHEARERFDLELAEAMRGLCRMLMERYALDQDDLPQSPQRRMAAR